MAKEELLQFEGLVAEILPDARYRVVLDNGHALVCYTAGRMKKNRIKTLAGDRVTVEVSPYDLEKGRLIFRHTRTSEPCRLVGRCTAINFGDVSFYNEDSMTIENNAVKTSGPIRIFIFKSETSPDLRAFGGDLAGSRLPVQFRPWHAIGSIAPEGEFPYKLSRESIETAINDSGYQLWRMRKKSNSE